MYDVIHNAMINHECDKSGLYKEEVSKELS
jgi:hypothetical protein